MYLKKLEMQGFKSFPDKTVLSFEDGLTAVIGPNGSGKSNIGDAVSWVMGEQSAKTLRGAKMEDIIFSGTAQRRPVGSASVTLLLDNSSGAFSLPEPEISVTRRLYRSGESDFLINGRSVRLKDITELFMDTGLGKNGYSIIGQGRIAEIINSKPSERRDIFEEAAGIARFRYKKKEAIASLESTEAHFLRLNDSLVELQQRLEPLREQSEKAALFIELSEKQKIIQISLWLQSLSDIAAKLRKNEEQYLIASADYEAICRREQANDEKLEGNLLKIQYCTARLDELQQLIINSEKDISELTSQITVLDHDAETARQELAVSQARLIDNDKERLAAHERIDEQKKVQQTLAAEVENKNAMVSAICEEQKRFSAEAEGLSEQYGYCASMLNKLNVRKSALTAQISSATDSIRDMGLRAEERSTKREELNTRLDDINEKLTRCRRNAAETEQGLDEQKNRIAGFERLIASKNTVYRQTKAELDELSQQLRDVKAKIKLLTDLENSMEGYPYAVKELLKASKNRGIPGIIGTVAQLISVDDKCSLAIETALGGALQHIVVEDDNTAKRCIRRLQETKAGRATLLPISSIRGNTLSEPSLARELGFVALACDLAECADEHRNIVNSLLGRIAVCEELDSASRIAKKYNYRFRIVTLDGQVINAGGSYTGGSAARSAGLLSRKHEIEALREQLQDDSEDEAKLAASVAQLRDALEKLRFDFDGAQAEARRYNDELVVLRAEEQHCAESLVELKVLMNDYSAEAEQLESKSMASVRAKEALEAELKACTDEATALEGKMGSEKSHLDELNTHREEIAASLSAERIKLAELMKDVENASAYAASLQEALELIDASDADIMSVIASLNKKLEENAASASEAAAHIERVKSSRMSHTDEISEKRALRDELEAANSRLRIDSKEITSEKERSYRETSRLEERKISMNKEADTIVAQLWDTYELTRSEAGELVTLPIVVSTAQRELTQIVSEIKKLGSVNLSAIEEYKEVSARSEFLSAQLDDVRKAKNELVNLIDSLTDNMKRVFLDSFNRINSNFQEIFTELFGGGRASLTLTQPDEVLESGIDIEVAPPGKIIKNLLSLSGGEQAFIAIAIYFAIFRLKPSPFCILDEIDAALDEVNVRKLAAYLRNFTDSTQFIMITHKRGAMEEADVLYGVTMQSDGISRLLRMSQSEFAV